MSYSHVYSDCSYEESSSSEVHDPIDAFHADEVTNDVLGESNRSLINDLRGFFLETNLSVRHQQSLLGILNRHGVHVPNTTHKFNKAAKVSAPVVGLTNQTVYYDGLEKALTVAYENKTIDANETDLKLQIGIDGLPLFGSSTASAWPILARTINTMQPMCIGMYYGDGKPNLNNFLHGLVEELPQLKEGKVIAGDIRRVSSVVFIADAVARSFLQGIKGHNSFDGCGYCRIDGERCDNRTIFPFVDATPRTNEAYASSNEENQESESPLLSVCSFIDAFPPDYMHCVCLGVVRKLLHVWVSGGKTSVGRKLSSSGISSLNEKIMEVAFFVPSDFQRRLRSLRHLKIFKATEFRLFVLYLGPVVLRNVLPEIQYKHFLLLHFGIYCLCSDRSHELVDVAHSCLELFCSQLEELYGAECQTYNFHVIRHLAQYVRQLGPLDSFSAFAFESFLHQLKKRVKPTRYVLTHCVSEALNLQHMTFTKPSLIISSRKPNNCFQTEAGFVMISYVIDNVAYGRQLKWKEDIYSYPYPSRDLGIGVYSLTDKHVSGKIIRKCIAICRNADYIIVPYCHK